VHDDPQAPHVATDTYVTDAQTAWVTYTAATDTTVLHTRSVADRTLAQRTIVGDLLATPSALYFRIGNAIPDAAIYSASDASSTPKRYATLPPDTLAAQEIALTPGRVSWADDSTTAQPLYSRLLGSPNGVLTAGPRSLVANGFTGQVVAVSGLRTAYFTRSESGADPTLVVTDGTTSTQIAHADTDVPQGDLSRGVLLSGSRVSYLHRVGNGPATYRVLDLRTQRTIDTTATLGASTLSSVALWGNYYAYSKADGSLWRKDLSSSAPAVQVAEIPQSPIGDPETTQVYLWGDWVAYTHTVYEDIGPLSWSAFRNMRTQSSHTRTGGDREDRIVGASAGGIEFSVDPSIAGGRNRLSQYGFWGLRLDEVGSATLTWLSQPTNS
jgi:hypothetical protein